MDNKLPVLTVSQITQILKTTVRESFFGLTVEGEVSGFKIAPTGHWYFALKDSGALLNATIWKSTAARLGGFIPKDGQKVVVKGSIDIYEPRGTYSINCTSIRPSGEGDILAQLEEKKRHYTQLGYFDETLKKPIPERPGRVAVITSPTGAALQDILQVTGRRAGGVDIIILPALVQGDEAAVSIAKRIEQVNTFGLADVMIVGRGGGSVEDLLPFSQDCVIEAIHNSKIPVISAVGHEIDWAISDFVADLRAPTPSAAAELVCKNQGEQLLKVKELTNNMILCVEDKIRDARRSIDAFSPENAFLLLQSRLSGARMNLDSAMEDLIRKQQDRVYGLRNSLDMAVSTIQALSPKAVLERGYSIVTSNGKTLSDASKTKEGGSIEIIMNKGRLSALVKEVKNG